MRVNFNPIIQNSLINSHKVNQSLVGQNISISERRNKDEITISPQGKANSLLENLSKQKANIMEQKSSLISSTLEKGESMDSIKTQLETYDEQLKNIDNQISQTIAKEFEKQTEKQKLENDNKPKTEQEIQNEKLANISNLYAGLTKAKIVSSVKAKVDSNARVLKSDIKLDKTYGSSFEAISKKQENLAEMELHFLELTSKISDKIAEVTEKITDINKPQEVVPEIENSSNDTTININVLDTIYEKSDKAQKDNTTT